MNQPTLLQPIFQVSEVVELTNNHLELLGQITLEGELSEYKRPNRSLIFGTVKDTSSSLALFGLSHQIHNAAQLQVGMHVRLTGTIGLYQKSGRLRLHVTSITPLGAGAYNLFLQQLRAQLQAEGIFHPAHKKPLPPYPETIALVTASQSSAYYDVVKIMSTRFPTVQISHLPVTVQGQQAVPTIYKALKYLSRHPAFDLVIITRGGGGIEDLQAFNDERIVRAAFALPIPFISAIGHEDNWTLLDEVADARASTPSNAAEIAVPTVSQVTNLVIRHTQQCCTSIQRRVADYHQTLSFSQKVTASHLYRLTQKHLNLENQLRIAKRQCVSQIQSMQAITRQHLINNLRIVKSKVEASRQTHQSISQVLSAYQPETRLAQGYSITRDQAGHILKHLEQVSPNQKIITQFAQGKITSTITQVESHDQN